jgi:ABC-type sugar transport system substrate-binding protein
MSDSRISLRARLKRAVLAGALLSTALLPLAGMGQVGAQEDYYTGFEPPVIEQPEPKSIDTSAYAKPEGEELVIAYADASLSNSWRVMAKAELEYGISQLPNARLVYTNANDSTPKQIADMDDLIAQRVDAIILAATDVNALCPSIDKALAANIPVILLERMVNCPNYTVWVATDAEQVARYHMEYIAWRLGGEGKIAIVSGVPGAGHSVEMEQVYADVLENHPGIEVVATEYANYDPAQARQVVDALLVAHPDLDAIASISGNITIGVFEAVDSAGLTDQMKAWTGDDANGWMKIHAEHDLPAMTVPLPPLAGRYAAQQAYEILQGNPVEQIFQTPKWSGPMDFSENIDNYANFDRPDEWWYTDMPCEYDPFCK